MSKSYRYDPDEGDFCGGASWTRDDDGFCEPAAAEAAADAPAKPKRRGKKKKRGDGNPYPAMTPEWAMELMKERIGAVVDLLAKQRVIPEHERDDVMQTLNLRICDALPTYDPDWTDEDGKTTSVERYLSVVIDNTVRNVKMDVARRRKNVPVVPFLELDGDDESEDADGKECEGNPFKDHHRRMEELWIRMDLEELSLRLTPIERLVLACSLAEFTMQETVQEVALRHDMTYTRFKLTRQTMPSLRKKACALGFTPHVGEYREDV